MITTDAWVLYAGDAATQAPGSLVREPFSLGHLAADEVLIEPIYGSWEANMTHAIERRPIDVCRSRGEAKVVLGNCGVARVVDIGSDVRGIAVGADCLFFGAGRCDTFGYTELAHAYDCPNSIGLLAQRTKVRPHNLIPIPAGTQYTLQQWAAFSGKYVTAWSNWRVAHGALRLQLAESELPTPSVWGWGGGTTLAELDLARRMGCSATMVSGSDTHLDEIRAMGVDTVDRRRFPRLEFDSARYKADPEYAETHRTSERDFLEEVRQRTGGLGASIFVDYIGSPMLRVTLRALARQGVLTTAGWKHGMQISLLRAVECIQRHTHVHTHYARRTEAEAAITYAEQSGWMPPPPAEYTWDAVPTLAADYQSGRLESYFAVFAVNP